MSIRTFLTIALGLAFLYALFTVGLPFLLALIAAIFLEPAVLQLMKVPKLSRTVSALAICTMFTLVMLGLCYWIGVKIVTELVGWAKLAPTYLHDADAYIQQMMSKTDLFYSSLPPSMAEQARGWIESGAKSLTASVSGILTAVSGWFINLAVVIPDLFMFYIVAVISMYLLCAGLPRLKRSFLKMFDERSRGKVEQVLVDLRTAIFGLLLTQIVVSVFTYVLMVVGLLVLRVDYPLAIALLIVIVDILPVLGIGAVLVPWSIYGFAVHDFTLGIGLLALFLIATVARRIVEPKVLGNAVGIGSLSSLISLYVGYKLLGMTGLFLGPVAVILFQALRNVGLLKIDIKLE